MASGLTFVSTLPPIGTRSCGSTGTASTSTCSEWHRITHNSTSSVSKSDIGSSQFTASERKSFFGTRSRRFSAALLPPFPSDGRPVPISASQSETMVSPGQTSQSTSGGRITFLEGNSWVLEAGGLRVYVDPWLVGDLIFFNTPFLYRGIKRTMGDMLADVQPGGALAADLIVLSQGLEDHAHLPTLRALDKSIPVVAAPSAVKICQDLGFRNVTALPPSQSVRVGELEIFATAGSVVGPPWQAPENGYVFSVPSTSFSLYYEPHGNNDLDVLATVPNGISAVLTPVVQASLPLLGDYQIVNGAPEALTLVEKIKPKTAVALTNFNLENEGALMNFLAFKGTADSFAAELDRRGLSTTTRFVVPQPGVPIELPA